MNTCDPATFEDTGMFPGIPYAEYEKWPGLRRSRIYTLNEGTPKHYKWELDHPAEVDTEALMIGRATHTAILEPEQFEVLYICEPEPPGGVEKWDRRLKIHKAAWADWLASIGDKQPLTIEQWVQCQEMRDAVWDFSTSRRILESGQKEVSMQWRDAKTDLLLKARLDVWIPNGAFADLKTAASAAPGPFERASYKFGYPCQMAFYWSGATATSGLEVGPPVLIVVEKKPPYCVGCHKMLPEAMGTGTWQYETFLQTILGCQESGEWPGYPEGTMDLSVPGYAGMELVGT